MNAEKSKRPMSQIKIILALLLMAGIAGCSKPEPQHVVKVIETTPTPVWDGKDYHCPDGWEVVGAWNRDTGEPLKSTELMTVEPPHCEKMPKEKSK